MVAVGKPVLSLATFAAFPVGAKILTLNSLPFSVL